jgi:ABC-type thiamine transport system ATPase subunit
MLTNIIIRNFKKVKDASIELGKSVVFIGPNYSGKTTALQAIALWDIGLKRWNEKRSGQSSPEKRPGVTINRRDLISIPVPNANLLWRDLHVRKGERVNDESVTKNVFIDIVVDGVTDDKAWSCGFEFYYANEESFYCRPLRKSDQEQPDRMEVPSEASEVKVAFLPPMSGLAAVEPKWESGRVNVLLGEGQTAQVLRNLCYQIYQPEKHWKVLNAHIQNLFGASLLAPEYIKERGEITMAYKEHKGVQLDISCSGRGLQQTLLVLAYLYTNPGSILLIDEPDAHLEILRQRQIYQLLTQIAEEQGSQIIAASHSEVVLQEAAERDIVIAFVGNPHRIDDRGSQVLKSLREIGFEHYYLAEQMGWVLYLEGSTDLAILRTFAETLGHKAFQLLERPFVYYVGNNPIEARRHFHGLLEAKKDLVGIAIYDRMERELQKGQKLVELMWNSKEIENYLCLEEVLLAYASYGQSNDLFGVAEAKHRKQAMRESIKEVSDALKTLKGLEAWSADVKASEEFLEPLFKKYFEKLGLSPNLLQKTNYHTLARFVSRAKIDSDIIEKLDMIVAVASQANPL